MNCARRLAVPALVLAGLCPVAAIAEVAVVAAVVATAAVAVEAPRPLFIDATEDSGLDFVHDHGGDGRRYLPETMGAGGCVLDVDGDGIMDLYLVQSGRLDGEPTAGGLLARGRGDGTFEEVTARWGAAVAAYGQGAVCADFDGDGDTDIYLTAVGANVLLRNDGDRFREITDAVGVADPAWSSSATFFDADGDGDLDLYVVNYLAWSVATHRDCTIPRLQVTQYCHPDVYPSAADSFYLNRGDGTFERLEPQATGLLGDGGKGLGVVAADFDNDGRVDLYVANDSTPNFLFRNLGPGDDGRPRFEEIGLIAGVSHNALGHTEAGMGVDAGDVDGDGFLDLVVTNLSLETNTLYLGGPYGFVDATRRAGLYGPSLPVLGFGVDLLDLDLDGDLDLFVANGDVLDNIELVNDGLRQRQPGQVFLNDGTGRFIELPAAQVGAPATPRVARGAMTLDFDNDGRLDLLVSYNHDRARLYRNVTDLEHRRWLGLHLVGRPPNPGAVGARVTVIAGGRRQIEEVKAGSGYQVSNDPRLVFGLPDDPSGGTPRTVERVEVRWPDGSRQALHGLAVDRYHRLRQPQSAAGDGR